MNVYHKGNTRRGGGDGLNAYLLIGQSNTGNANLSLQYSEVEVGSGQPLHRHEPEQCYYIVAGEGLMTIGDETRQVKEGDALLVPANEKHGIKNNGTQTLKYISANTPAFDLKYEKRLWAKEPEEA